MTLKQMATMGWLQSLWAMGIGESVIILTICGGISVSNAPYLPCNVDLIDTISCLNCCMLSLADGR